MKAAIYDMDDLVVNSKPFQRSAWAILQKYGHHLDEVPDDIKASYVGRRIFDICGIHVAYFQLPVTQIEYFKERQARFMDLVRGGGMKSMPGLQHSLDLFKENGYRFALATSGEQEYVDLVLAQQDLIGFFEVIVTGSAVTRGKPEPDTFRIACDKLRLPPYECVVLEDATNGVAAAKAAGCKCIGVHSRFEPNWQDLSRADIELKSLEELTKKDLEKLG